MSITVRPRDNGFGAQITGITLNGELRKETVVAIKDLTPDESKSLLDTLFEHALQREFVYRLR